MRRILRVPLAAAACAAAVGSCVAVLAARPAPGPQRTFRSGVDLVTFGFSVVDRKGRVVTDLREGDVEVYEDGRKQAVRLFVPCDAQAGGGAARRAPVDLHLGALLDISGSMDRDLRFARDAAVKFLDGLQEARDYTLVDFDTEVRVSRFGQADFARLAERVRGRRAEGDTALWDAMAVYLDAASQQEGRRVLVVYTDGGDNASSLPFADLLGLLKASDATVHVVGLLEHQSSGAAFDQRARLQRMADVTGGQAFFPASAADLEQAYRQVRAEIDAQYTLGFVSANPGHDGAWRKVEIRVVRPGLTGARVRTRQGYYAPLGPGGPPPGE